MVMNECLQELELVLRKYNANIGSSDCVTSLVLSIDNGDGTFKELEFEDDICGFSLSEKLPYKKNTPE